MDYEGFLSRRRQYGRDSGFEPVWLPDCMFPFQRDPTAWAIRRGRAAIFADCGTGKLHPVSEPVLTPGGWKPIGEIRVGDEVIGRNGRPVRVTGVFPQGVREVVRVRFSDGAYSRCGWEHLWAVQTQNDRTRGKGYRTLTTRQIADAGLTYGKDRSSRQWSIPLVEPVDFPAADLPVPPYALGVILGDGSITKIGYVQITTDRCIAESLGVPGKFHDHDRTDWVCNFSTNAWSEGIRTLGLAGHRSPEKFVPSQYLAAPAADRLALLQGLMDTDGSPLPDGGTEFSSTSETLCDAVVDLARSLGGVARKKGPRITRYPLKGQVLEGKPSWRVNLKLPAGMNPFRVERKASLYVQPTKYCPVRLIDGIEPEGVSEESVCIMVDAQDHLYVARDYVVTHNTVMQLVWAENVVRHADRPVLILTPLAVGRQTVAEGAKFGIEAARSDDGRVPAGSRIVVTNYERLHHFDRHAFAGVVCDESGILKNFDGKTKAAVTEFMREIPYRLLCTATAAPNDYVEFGTSSETLGYLGYQDMLTKFFKQVTTKDRLGWGRTKYRLRGHAETDFWRWICSWARAFRKPSDLGYDDGPFVLPELRVVEHPVEPRRPAPGMLFDLPGRDMREEREEQRRTVAERCEKVAALASHDRPVVAWCHLNDESAALASLIPGAVEVRGSEPIAAKEEKLLAFASGQARVLVTKPRIAGFGLNWQHCAHQTYFPSHSWEQWYQGIRRSWRFGQTEPVTIDVVTTPGSAGVLENLRSKAERADRMFEALVRLMNDPLSVAASRAGDREETIPSWL